MRLELHFPGVMYVAVGTSFKGCRRRCPSLWSLVLVRCGSGPMPDCVYVGLIMGIPPVLPRRTWASRRLPVAPLSCGYSRRLSFGARVVCCHMPSSAQGLCQMHLVRIAFIFWTPPRCCDLRCVCSCFVVVSALWVERISVPRVAGS